MWWGQQGRPTSPPSPWPLPSVQFGKVYKGLWQGQEVAVKSMVLPLTMLGTEKRECMAVMEAAISSSLRHPNIVQVGVNMQVRG